MDFLRILFLGVMAVMLTACFNVATTSMQMAYNHRNFKKNFDDQYTTFRAYRLLTVENPQFKDSNFTIATYNGVVLLAGQTPTKEQAKGAEQLVQTLPGAQKIYNFIEVSAPSSRVVRLNDSWITTKIKSKIIASDEVDASSVKVVTENGTVFLMGVLQPEEADAAVALASETEGVQRVVKMFSYLHLRNTEKIVG